MNVSISLPAQGTTASGTGAPFLPVEVANGIAEIHAGPAGPRVLRGLAADWPAVSRWTFPFLAAQGQGLPVRLVLGNRERHGTRFAPSTLDRYLATVEQAVPPGEAPPYLKEFDLLKAFPALAGDLHLAPLFPPGALVWNDTWIGPRGSHTGLHYDRLDNLAVMLRGRKRFRLAPPGSVEALGAVSRKYDRVSVMADANLAELATRRGASPFYEVELQAGDALYTPAGWWHEVHNHEAAIFVSGFFGSRRSVAAKWLATLPRHLAHQAGLWRHGHCVCHPERAAT